MIKQLDLYWDALNYLSVGQLYLQDNPLLKRPLQLSDIKNKNGILSDKELMFLYKIIFDVSNCLDSIKHIDVEYESREVSDIESSLYEEIEKRNIYEKTLKL